MKFYRDPFSAKSVWSSQCEVNLLKLHAALERGFSSVAVKSLFKNSLNFLNIAVVYKPNIKNVWYRLFVEQASVPTKKEHSQTATTNITESAVILFVSCATRNKLLPICIARFSNVKAFSSSIVPGKVTFHESLLLRKVSHNNEAVLINYTGHSSKCIIFRFLFGCFSLPCWQKPWKKDVILPLYQSLKWYMYLHFFRVSQKSRKQENFSCGIGQERSLRLAESFSDCVRMAWQTILHCSVAFWGRYFSIEDYTLCVQATFTPFASYFRDSGLILGT